MYIYIFLFFSFSHFYICFLCIVYCHYDGINFIIKLFRRNTSGRTDIIGNALQSLLMRDNSTCNTNIVFS